MPSRPFATTSFNKASQFDHNLYLFAVGPLKAPIQKLPVNTSALFVQHIKTKKISILSRSFQTHIDRFWILMNVFSTLYLMAFCFQTKVLCQSSRCPENVDGEKALPSGCSTTHLIPFVKHNRISKLSREQNKLPSFTKVYPWFPKYSLKMLRPWVW